MARRKQISPMQRIPSGEVMQTPPDIPWIRPKSVQSNGHLEVPNPRKAYTLSPVAPKPAPSGAGAFQLIICVLGIYTSFLTWAYLQERITTTPYASTPTSILNRAPAQEYFRYPVFLNTIQALFAFLSGTIYLYATTGSFSIFPTRSIVAPLLLVSITSSLASPFGYAALAHVDYLTFVLAKSCKLLPVMALHVTLFRRRYPLSKYLIVLTVSAGVAIFTLYHPPSSKSSSSKSKAAKSSLYGLALLGINLLFDGLTNTIQDHIFASPARYGPIRGPQMMVAQNILSTLLMSTYLLLTPSIPPSLLPTAISPTSTQELAAALTFLQHHPTVLNDILGFAACGAVGQLFIYATLERFSSLLLVTVTVTRKMLTMLLSVFWYGKRLTGGQWAGVGLVFGGVGAEGWMSHQEKSKRAKKKLMPADERQKKAF